MSSPLPKFWRRHCSTQDLREIHVWNTVWGPPFEPKSWSRYWYSSVILLILIIILVLYAVNAYPNLKSKVRLCLHELTSDCLYPPSGNTRVWVLFSEYVTRFHLLTALAHSKGGCTQRGRHEPHHFLSVLVLHPHHRDHWLFFCPLLSAIGLAFAICALGLERERCKRGVWWLTLLGTLGSRMPRSTTMWRATWVSQLSSQVPSLLQRLWQLSSFYFSVMLEF